MPAGRQNDVDELGPPAGKDDATRGMIRARLKQRLMQYINENHVPDITKADIIWCSIMDWGRLPYGAATMPGAQNASFGKRWHSLATSACNPAPKAQTPDGSPPPHVHVCGEPFADYTGFIERSLRSATYTMTKILRKNGSDATAAVLDRILRVLKKGLDAAELDSASVTTSKTSNPGSATSIDVEYARSLNGKWRVTTNRRAG